MAAVDFRSAYELLRRVMEQQDLERQGASYGSMASTPSASESSSYGSPQSGLLGRLIELQEQQRAYQPYPGDGRAAPSEPKNPNFRKLTRVDVQPQGAVAPSGDQSGSSDYLVGTTFDAPSKNLQGAGLLGIPGYMPAPRWGVPLAGGIPLPLPGRKGIPFPPIGPGSVTEIPNSAVPDAWKHAWTLLQLFPSLVEGLRGREDQHGATILYSKEASPDDENEGDDPAPPLDDPRWSEWFKRDRKRARDKENRERWAGKLKAEHDFCSQRYVKECDECKEIAKDKDDLRTCEAQAGKRLGSCEKNGGPSRADPRKWRPYVEQ